MSFNGSGTFVINSAGQPVVADTTITDTDFNAFTADMATGLSNCVTKDGQTTPTANIPMGGYRITGLGIGSATTDAMRMDNANASMCEFRLTLQSSVPVPATDVTGATTIYCTPYKGSRIALYSGGGWVMRSSEEFSKALGTLTAYIPNDVFAYDNAGVATLEFAAWTSATSRAPNFTLTRLNGVLVKSGTPTRRYLGTFYPYSTTQTTDSSQSRLLWNFYNRVPRRFMLKLQGTAGYTYTTNAVRQANGNGANLVEMMIGISEDPVEVTVMADAKNSSAGVLVYAGPALDSVSAFSATNVTQLGFGMKTLVAGVEQPVGAVFNGYPGVGFHYIAWCEDSAATGTTTWNSSTYSGMTGRMMG